MNKALTALTLVLFAAPLLGQPKAKPVEVEVKRVIDRRSTGSFAHLMITLDLPKIKSADVAAYRVLVTSAVDDSGRSLLDTESQEPQLQTNHHGGMSGPELQTMPTSLSVDLENPDRKATKVKEVRGEIELYMPSKDANSIAEIPKFLATAGKALNHKALKANGVEITILSPTQLEAEKKRLQEAKKKEYMEIGYEGESLEEMLKNFVESLLSVEESELMARVKDPNKRIQEISYVDAAGEVKRVMVSDEEGLSKLSMWGDKPAADWKMRVSMVTPKNLVRHAFALTDVPLP